MSRKLQNLIKQSVNENALSKIINVGDYPELDQNEKDAIIGHRKGNQSHLLRENFIIHKRGLTVTKSIDNIKNIPEFVGQVMDACNFDLKISIATDKKL